MVIAGHAGTTRCHLVVTSSLEEPGPVDQWVKCCYIMHWCKTYSSSRFDFFSFFELSTVSGPGPRSPRWLREPGTECVIVIDASGAVSVRDRVGSGSLGESPYSLARFRARAVLEPCRAPGAWVRIHPCWRPGRGLDPERCGTASAPGAWSRVYICWRSVSGFECEQLRGPHWPQEPGTESTFLTLRAQFIVSCSGDRAYRASA